MGEEDKNTAKASKVKILFRVLNIVFCVFIALGLILYVNLDKVVNSFLNPEYIKEIVNKNTGLILDLGKPQIYATKDFSINLKSSNVALCEPNCNNCALFYIEDIDTEIKILPLLFKKIEFKKLVAKDLKLNVERDMNGKFNIQKYFKGNSKFPFEIEAKNASILISKYLINVIDKKNALYYEISGEDLVSTEFNLDNYADIKTKGSIKFQTKNKTQISPYALDVKLKFPLTKNIDFKDYKLQLSVLNLDFSYFEPYIKEFISKNTLDIKTIKGKGSITILPSDSIKDSLLIKSDIENLFLVIFRNNHNNIIDIGGKSTVETVLRFKKDEILINDFNFKKEKINLKANGSLKNISNIKKLNPDIDIEITNTSLKDALKIAPDYLIKLQQPYIPNLKKYNANALVNGKFKIKDRFRFPNMYGEINLDDVYLIEKPNTSKTSNVKVIFNGSDVDINVIANCPNNQKVIVKGQTEIKELPVAKFDIQSTPAIDMEFAHKILIPIHKIFGFQLGPLPFMKIKGTGEISLKTKGTRESASLNGYFRTKNGTASLYGLNTVLYNGNLNLLFKDKKIIFDNTTGIVEGAKIKVDGSSDIEGKLDLYVKVFDVDAIKALDVVKTSEMVLSLLGGGSFLDAYTNPKGKLDFNMHLWGKASEIGDTMTFEPSDTMFSKGSIIFKNNSLDIFPEIKASKINGTLDFSDFVTLNLNADIYSSPFTLNGTIKPDTKASKIRTEQPQMVDLIFNSKSANSFDLYKFFYDNQEGFQAKNKISKELYDFLNKINFKFAANIRAKGKIDPKDTMIDMKKFTLDGWAVGLNHKESDVLFNSGSVKFKGQKLLFKDLNTILWGANVVSNGEIDKIFDDYFIPNMHFKLLSFPFSKLEDLSSVTNDKNVKKVLGDFNEFKGNLNGDFYYNSKGFDGNANFNQVSLFDKKRDLPVFLNSGDLRFSNTQIKLNALNMSYGHTPVYIDAVLDDFNTNKPRFNAFVSTNLNEESLDKLLNPNLQFPLKTKGEFNLKGRLRGQLDDYSIFATVILNPGTDLYYMGANLGDVQNKREINSRIDFKNDEVNIRNIKYQKYILSQNNKQTPYEMLKLSGALHTDGNNLLLDNFKMETPNPAPARLLNPVFKKSVLKQGTFNADILLNGPVMEPKAKGKVKFSNVDIPLYDTQVKDVDLILDEKLIKAAFEGTGMKSDVKVLAEIVNKPALPVVVNKAEITSKIVDLNRFLEGLTDFSKVQKTTDPAQKQAMVLSPLDIEIKDGIFSADEIHYNNLKAQNFKGRFKHTKDGRFIFNDIVFDTAGGKIKTSGSYEFDSTKININSEIKDCDANTLVTDLFGVKNQIFGKTNGKINLSGHQLNTVDGINNIKADVDFAIYDGKMPKLGSLEYLLRAGNLLKSGILGFTINNVIEVLIPYKTGEFKRISGDFIVEDGKISKLNIYSKGDNLSIYTTGTYDIATNVGDFDVFGKLSTKISNLLGPIGNASVYSILNIFTNDKLDKKVKENMIKDVEKIPDIAGASSDFRLFAVEILGDLNADSFVKSFNWLN